MTDPEKDRRRFKRIAFDAITEVRQGQNRWQVTLIDLSLKGLLIHRPDPWLADTRQPFAIDLRLSSDVHVQMDAHLTHDDHRHLGFECLYISLESISHLRRLIELNLGDQDELERELAALIEV
ncbi:PilZ domain-containing protein [Pseudomonas sp. DWP3-1-2]|uniref:PilZ domain-containing protein n=1 Tax=Pseudomonas sp. DWP3-1-2 TaxID=2804645 RepID=UPI003CF06F07